MYKCMKNIIHCNTYFHQRKFFARIFMVMKITVLFLLIAISSAFANSSYSQITRFTLRMENVSIQQVFDEIQKKSEFIIFYKDNQVDNNHRSSVDVVEATVDQILNQAFKNTNLGYKIIDRQIVITGDKTKETPSAIKSETYAEQKKVISGIVRDGNGVLLPGVTVIVKGTTIGTVTDNEGNFRLALPEDAKILVFSFIGMNTKEITLAGKIFVNATLYEKTFAIDEVVAIGYGIQRRTDVSGAVASVNASATKERVIMSLGDALKGQVSGVAVTSFSGEPGSGNSINIRGNTSLSGDSEPLYVVDGIISQASDVVPSQIASIDILKDASSTAIYGSRGANGVILITTIGGKTNKKTSVNLYAMYGIQQMAKTLHLLNSKQYADVRYTGSILRNDIDYAANNPYDDIPNQRRQFLDEENRMWFVSRTPFYGEEYYNMDDFSVNTDWQKELYRLAPVQDYRLTVNGGSDQTTYSFMFGNKNQKGIQIGSSYADYSVRANITQKLGSKANLTFNTSLIKSITNPSVVGNAINRSPLSPVEASLYVEPTEVNNPPRWITNPLFYADLIVNETKAWSYSTNVTLDYQIAKGLKLYLNGTYITRNGETEQFYPATVSQGYSQGGVAAVSESKREELRSENSLRYDKILRSHRFSAIIGNSISESVYRTNRFSNSNFPLQDLGVPGINEGLNPSAPGYSYTKTTGLSWFGRIEDTYKDKYIIKASYRMDGSSVFAKNNKWGYFPSAAAAWRVSQEKWMQKIKPISNLKLRLSYGVSGKQAIQPYQSLSMAQLSKMSENGTSNSGSIFFNRLGNDDLKWETTKEADFGIDLALFHDRLSFVFDIYDRVTSDLLYSDPLPDYSGYAVQMRNIGKLGNKGLELSVSGVPVRTKNFSWNISFNISHNVTTVLGLGLQDWKTIGTGWAGSNATQGLLKVGERLGNWYGYKTNGIWQSWAEIDQAVLNGDLPANGPTIPGFIHYADPALPKGTQTGDDREVLGNGFPDFSGGMSNSFSYKGLSLSLMFQYSYGQDVFNATSALLDGIYVIGGVGSQYSANVLNNWAPTLYYYDNLTGQKGEIAMPGNKSNRYPTNYNQRINTTESVPLDWYVQDASYVRLADLTLAYTFPKKLMTKFKMSNLRLFLNATNLFVLTNYEAYDPEVNNSGGQASYLLPGLDNNSYPRAKTYSFGFTITF